jgi:hypothetical protein
MSLTYYKMHIGNLPCRYCGNQYTVRLSQLHGKEWNTLGFDYEHGDNLWFRDTLIGYDQKDFIDWCKSCHVPKVFPEQEAMKKVLEIIHAS